MSSIKNQQARYSTGAIVLHWLMATLILLNFIAAFVAEDMAKPDKMAVMGNHKAIGLIVLALAVVRIVWRLMHPAPAFDPRVQPWERILARITHSLFYVLIVAIPLAGWIMVSGGGGIAARPLGIPVPALPVGDPKAAGAVAHEMHELLAFAMLGLIALHLAGALKHHFVNRDGTLGRMLPFLRR